MTGLLVFIYATFFGLGILIQRRGFRSIRGVTLCVACCCLCLLAGSRSTLWPDTSIYLTDFKNYIYPFFSNGRISEPSGYDEYGFIMISRVIKTITTSETIYLGAISIVTVFFLHKSLRNYCVYPLIGLCVYVARFFPTRDMMQIRAALAILILIGSTCYLVRKQYVQYVCTVFIAALFHKSMIAMLPMIFFAYANRSNRTNFFLISGAFLLTIATQSYLTSFVDGIFNAVNLGNTYTGGDVGFTTGKGLYNPMIYYQITLLFLYTWSVNNRNYSLIRNELQRLNVVIGNCYAYSTLLLICLSPLLVLSARLSTIFATYEICIIPYLINAAPYKTRALVALCFMAFYTVCFYLNLSNLTFL